MSHPMKKANRRRLTVRQRDVLSGILWTFNHRTFTVREFHVAPMGREYRRPAEALWTLCQRGLLVRAGHGRYRYPAAGERLAPH